MPRVTRRRHHGFILPLLLAFLCAGCELIEDLEDRPGMKGGWTLHAVNGKTYAEAGPWTIGTRKLNSGMLLFSHDDAGWVIGSAVFVAGGAQSEVEHGAGTFVHTRRSGISGTVELSSPYGSLQGSVWHAQGYDLVEIDASFLLGSAGRGTVLTFGR